jgi:arylsulfatase A-like enzyme
MFSGRLISGPSVKWELRPALDLVVVNAKTPALQVFRNRLPFPLSRFRVAGAARRQRVLVARLGGRLVAGVARGFLTALLLLAAPLLARADAEPRPSILLIVIDTLRFDAVSAYGQVDGTTPSIDRLAQEGILYWNARAQSSWTLPSHAGLLTGLAVQTHQVGMPGRMVLPESIETLAERMAKAGYETAGFSENSLVSDYFGLLQGFEHRAVEPPMYAVSPPIGADDGVRIWATAREPGRPAFVFVNLYDPHAPYEIRATNPFVPAGTPDHAVRARVSSPGRFLCGGLPSKEQIGILKGLYLGEVAVADAKVARIVRAVQTAVKGRLITIVTSDHGEFFGEHRLLDHEFGLYEAVLRIPLVVHGAPGAQTGRVDEAVALADLAPSILRWAGEDTPDMLEGRTLPLPGDGAQPPRSLVAAYSDHRLQAPPAWKALPGGAERNVDRNLKRQFCAPSDPVFGAIVSLVRFPYKFYWFERYPPALYNLSWDPHERSNLAQIQPELVGRLEGDVMRVIEGTRLLADDLPLELPDAAEDALRALGYVE